MAYNWGLKQFSKAKRAYLKLGDFRYDMLWKVDEDYPSLFRVVKDSNKELCLHYKLSPNRNAPEDLVLQFLNECLAMYGDLLKADYKLPTSCYIDPQTSHYDLVRRGSLLTVRTESETDLTEAAQILLTTCEVLVDLAEMLNEALGL